MELTFSNMTVYVQDVQGAVNFYQQAFGLPVGYMEESGQYAELSTGATKLTFTTATIGEGNITGAFTPTMQPRSRRASCLLSRSRASRRHLARHSGPEPLRSPHHRSSRGASTWPTCATLKASL